MSKTEPGPKELANRALAQATRDGKNERAASPAAKKPKGKIPYAGKPRHAREELYGNGGARRKKP